jgi:ABC-type transport system involved in cytochrome bd biosynthesis fused ATPase/permease subunit
MFLPRALSAAADARSAISRISTLFEAEVRAAQGFDIIDDLNLGVFVENATFEWEEVYLKDSDGTSNSLHPHSPFRIQDVAMQVKRGSLVAVVGRVGAGKSSLLMGLIGEMRKVSGTVKFGGRLAYCSQTAWIQNASLVSLWQTRRCQLS